MSYAYSSYDSNILRIESRGEVWVEMSFDFYGINAGRYYVNDDGFHYYIGGGPYDLSTGQMYRFPVAAEIYNGTPTILYWGSYDTWSVAPQGGYRFWLPMERSPTGWLPLPNQSYGYMVQYCDNNWQPTDQAVTQIDPQDAVNIFGPVIDILNKAPAAITLDSTTVAENVVASGDNGLPIFFSTIHIANISGFDPDQDDLTYSITGGSDAASFEIVNGMLHLATGVSADYETQSSYSVTLTATDLEGLTYSEDFTITVLDIIETLTGTLSNDQLNGFSGINIINGEDGVDRVSYALSNNNVSFSLNADDQLVISGSTGQSQTLISVERIQLTDTAYALDLDGNTGIATKTIIAAFGTENLGSYISTVLSLVDSGTSLESLCDLVVDLKLIDQLTESSSNNSFVGHLFNNIVGRSPNPLENALYTSQIDNGTYTKSSLLSLAANTPLTEALVTAKSVDLIGVPGSADGELLAIQYDALGYYPL
jgi:hypothetical protein